MQKQEKIFADGFIAKRNENAKDFLVVKLSLKADEATAFINKHQKNGWVNLEVKKNGVGKFYVELDTFVPQKQEEKKVEPTDELDF